MDVDAVWPFLHLLTPLDNLSIWVLRRVIQVDHLEPGAVAADEGRFDVLELILAFPILKELRQLVQDDQLYRPFLVNNAFRVVYPV